MILLLLLLLSGVHLQLFGNQHTSLLVEANWLSNSIKILFPWAKKKSTLTSPTYVSIDQEELAELQSSVSTLHTEIQTLKTQLRRSQSSIRLLIKDKQALKQSHLQDIEALKYQFSKSIQNMKVQTTKEIQNQHIDQLKQLKNQFEQEKVQLEKELQKNFQQNITQFQIQIANLTAEASGHVSTINDLKQHLKSKQQELLSHQVDASAKEKSYVKVIFIFFFLNKVI